MNDTLRTGIGLITIIASALHLLSDLMEAVSGGFTTSQLAINYVGFLLMPFAFVGLAAYQWPKGGFAPVCLSVLYAVTFIYFAHTSLLAIEDRIPDYPTLRARLGLIYTIHGAVMIFSGLGFAFVTIREGVLNKVGLVLFSSGLLLNLLAALIPVSEMSQIVGSSARNLGLIVIGVIILLRSDQVGNTDSR